MHNPKQNNVSNMACSLYVLSNFLNGMWEEHNVGGDKKKCWERIQWICCVDNDYN